MIVQTISQYKIFEKIGGMGEVYLAEDTELHRKIVLKFLPPQYTKDMELNTRFKRKDRTAAALNHPNIITIHGRIAELTNLNKEERHDQL